MSERDGASSELLIISVAALLVDVIRSDGGCCGASALKDRRRDGYPIIFRLQFKCAAVRFYLCACLHTEESVGSD